MIESLKEDRQLVVYAEIPQNSESSIWKNGQNAGMLPNLRPGKVPCDESILNYSLPCQYEGMLFCSLPKPPGDWRMVEVDRDLLSVADKFVTHTSSVNFSVEAQHWLLNRSWCWLCQCGSRGTIPVPSFGIFILTGFIWVLPKCTCVSWMLVLSPFPAS